jgi:hypothetical protein
MTDDLLTGDLPRSAWEALRKDADVASRKFRAAAKGAAAFGPPTKRNATWIAECHANADKQAAIAGQCEMALSALPSTTQEAATLPLSGETDAPNR